MFGLGRLMLLRCYMNEAQATRAGSTAGSGTGTSGAPPMSCGGTTRASGPRTPAEAWDPAERGRLQQLKLVGSLCTNYQSGPCLDSRSTMRL